MHEIIKISEPLGYSNLMF